MALASGAGALAGEPTARAEPPPRGDCHQVESEHFVFHSDPWVNLHHFVFQWARNVPERQAGDRRRAVAMTEAEQLKDLTQEERQAWLKAVNFYRERLSARDLVFDQNLIAVRGELAAIACSASGRKNGNTELRALLEEAMPVYRRLWWSGHHAGNTAWIEEQFENLKSHGAILASRLAEAYGGEWPSKKVRVDVVAYANWSAAYTTNHPDHVTLSGTSYPGFEGLEMLFHEVSHASFFEQRILGQLNAAFRPHGVDPPRRLFHVIQFVTPAELLRSLLVGEERDSFESVAERVYASGSFRDEYRVVLRHWKPFLDGRVRRAEALERIAEELVP